MASSALSLNQRNVVIFCIKIKCFVDDNNQVTYQRKHS